MQEILFEFDIPYMLAYKPTGPALGRTIKIDFFQKNSQR